MTTPTPELFEIVVGANGRLYLKDAARWAKFLAIAGLIFCALCIAVSFWSISFTETSVVPGWHTTIYPPAFIFGAIIQIGFPVFCFFPCVLLLRFSNRSLKALRENDGDLLARSFRSMRSTYRFIAVLMVLGMVFFLVVLVIAIAVDRVPASIG
jgi:hypothetical protein